MKFITTKSTAMRLTVLLFLVVAITAAVVWSSSLTPARAQPPCDHDWCDWYEVCRWEYWAWDEDDGWERLHTDGYC
jgi:hypothetical protein